MIRLHIARHGEPARYVDGKDVDDPGLTDQGMREVEALADRLLCRTVRRRLCQPSQKSAENGRACDRNAGPQTPGM